MWTQLSIFLACTAIFYGLLSSPSYGELQAVKAALVAANGAQRFGSKRFLIGTNAAVDVILPAIDFFEAAQLQSDSAAVGDRATLATPQHVADTFAHFFHHGAAAERAYTDAQSYSRLAKMAAGLHVSQLHTGGNAALMAEYLASTAVDNPARPTHDVTLVALAGPQLQQLLHPLVKVPESCLRREDEYHLILEYGQDQEWQGYRSPRANRFIFSHDDTNARMLASAELSQVLAQDTRVDVVVVSGLNMLDGQNETVMVAKLNELATILKAVPKHVIIHLELASLSNPMLMRHIAFKLVPKVDSLGLNEQELLFFTKTLQGDHHEFASGPVNVPPVDVINDVVYWLIKRFGGSRLSRVHFHSLTFHVVAHRQGVYTSALSSVSAGAYTSSTRACQDPSLTLRKYTLPFERTFALSKLHTELTQERPFNASQPLLEWTNDEIDFALAPILVCRQPLKTVGLGDSISAAGLENLQRA
eukprot:TRINITY_DN9114_c0_g1_i1.p1 TRINITY_DN9114_c0_g1~~TRINITY_DN9114_c0_g1_i1.p1  ORF type:complete len:475 (+),score=106.62 TRINITY_DN9114_c0_g1_i1:156-1580(+)